MSLINGSPKSARPRGRTGAGCLLLFGLPFLAGGLAVGASVYFPALALWWSAQSWVETPCRIESTELRASSRGDGDSYKVMAVYHYRFAGKNYRNDKVSPYESSDNIGCFQQRTHQTLQTAIEKDGLFVCFVNPARPEQAVLFRDLRWVFLLLVSLFPTLFTLVGAAFLAGGILSARLDKRRRAQQARHPGQPWRWRPEWTGDTITAAPGYAAALLAAAGWIVLVQTPLVLAVLRSGILSGEPLAALTLLPLLLSLIPVALVWKQRQARRMLGQVSLRAAHWPFEPGGVCAGDLVFSRLPPSRAHLRLKLRCLRRRLEKDQDSEEITEETLWEHRETADASQLRRQLHGTILPLRVALPPGLPGTSWLGEQQIFSEPQSRVTHHWQLEVSCPGGGEPQMLALPVFKLNPETRAPEPDQDSAATCVAGDWASRLEPWGLRPAFGADGRLAALECLPGRFRLGLGLHVFGLILTVVATVLFWMAAPLVFGVLACAATIFAFALGFWLRWNHRRVNLTADGLRITTRLGPFWSRTREVPRTRIADFAFDAKMRINSQWFYRVQARVDSEKITVADGLRNSVTAEALVSEFERWRRDGSTP